MIEDHKLDPVALKHFTGSEHWFRHYLNRQVLYTEGAQYVAEHGGAYWLLDEIALAQHYVEAVKAQAFQAWRLTVRPDSTATVTCEDGNGKVVYTKAVTVTDFPLPEIVLWFENNTIYLPSER